MYSRRLLILLAVAAAGVPGAAAGAQQVAEIQVAPPSATLKVGERAGLLATAFDRIGNVIPTARFVWSSNNVQVARVDNNGTVTGVAPGVAIVEARSGARRGTAAVQVVGSTSTAGGGQAAPPRPAENRPGAAAPAAPEPLAGQPPGSGPAAALRIEPAAIYLLPSENTRIGVRALREDGSAAAPIQVTWKSLLTDIANVDAAGVVVALAPGQGTIQVTGPGGLTATAPVVVAQADVAIREQAPMLVSPGQTDTLHVIVPSQNGRLVSPLALNWTSSDPNVVRVNLLGAVTGVSAGKAVLTVTGLLQSRSIEVAVHKPVEILVARPRSSGELTLPLSATMKFDVQALAVDNTPVPEAPLRWSLSDTSVAEFGVATGTLTGKALGRTQLTVRAPGQGLAVTWTVNVVPGEVRITPGRVGLSPRRSVVLRADFVDDKGASLGPAQRVIWTSENPTVAAVGVDGTVSAGAWGRTRVIATAPGGKSAAADVMVIGEVVAARVRDRRMELVSVSREDLTALRPLGTDTLGLFEPAFSADGARIAAMSLRDGNAEIYLLDADGSHLSRLTFDPGLDAAPAFTPDGQSVVFHSDRAGRRLQIFSAGVDGKGLRQLTTDSTNSTPSVSPDGGIIAFVSTRERNYDIWLMARDGTSQRKFTNSAQWNERHPQFLKDGTLAYLVERREGNRTVTQVVKAELTTGQVTALSGIDLPISDFAVSPDGSLLALVVPASGQERRGTPVYRIVIVPVGAGTPVELSARPGESMLAPAFVP